MLAAQHSHGGVCQWSVWDASHHITRCLEILGASADLLLTHNLQAGRRRFLAPVLGAAHDTQGVHFLGLPGFSKPNSQQIVMSLAHCHPMTHSVSSVSPSGFSILKLAAANLSDHVSLSRTEVPACGSAVGLVDMPPDVVRAVLAAASPHEAAAAAALAETCRHMRRLMSFCTTAAKLRMFGRSQQLTPLLQRRLIGAC